MPANTEEKTETDAIAVPAAAAPTLPSESGLPATTRTTPLRMGLAPQSIEEGWRMATILAKSGLVPKDFRGKPEDILVAIELGVEVGLPPMQALQSIAVINGRPSIWGDGFLALILSSPLYRDHDEYFQVDGERREGLAGDDLKKDTTTAVCTFWRAGKTLPVTRTFSVAQAKKADLLGKQGPWQNYPDRMLRMRARSWAGRDAFPDLLRGMRTAEEAVDIPEDQDVIDIAPRAEPIQPRRASDVVPAADASRAPVPAAAVSAAHTPGGDAQRRDGTPSVPNGGDSGALSNREMRGRITGTKFVRPKQAGVDPFFEVTAKGDGPEIRFITRDERLYKEAVSFEGTDHHVRLGWIIGRTYEKGEIANVLEALAIDETDSNGLFR